MGRRGIRASVGEGTAPEGEGAPPENQGSMTRRALMVAGAASIAALAGEAIAAPVKVAAANGDPIKIGHANDGTSPTWLNGTSYPTFGARTTAGDGVAGETAGGGSGVYGHSTGQNGYGVFGRHEPTTNTGFVGGPDDAVKGTCKVAGHAGVAGSSSKVDGLGVRGENEALHTVGYLGGRAAVLGMATVEDTFGLGVVGHVGLSLSGVTTISAGKSSKKITGIDLREGGFVLATIQQYRAGVAVAAAVPSFAGQSITFYLTKAVPAATRIAWFVLDPLPA